jgi:hypothetical protein
MKLRSFNCAMASSWSWKLRQASEAALPTQLAAALLALEPSWSLQMYQNFTKLAKQNLSIIEDSRTHILA